MRKITIRSSVTLATFAIVALALVPFATGGTEGKARATVTTVQVKGGEFFFRLSTKSIARPGRVTFVFKNAGHVSHDFKINGRKTPVIQPGKTARLLVTFRRKAKYTYLCTVDSHASLGMKGVFTVR